MPVYKLILPVVSFSSQRPLPPLRLTPKPVLVEVRESDRRPKAAWVDDSQTPSADTPFG